jgi:hypothetical protein
MEQDMKRTAVGLAAVAALGVAVVIPAVGQSQTQRTITLTSSTQSVKLVDLPPRGKSSGGDVLVSVSRLKNQAGKRVGTSHLNCNVTQGSRSFEGATYECAGVNRLSDGTIAFSGVAKLGSAKVITVAVTGGTGAYEGASGTLVNTSTGDTTSTQVITLK